METLLSERTAVKVGKRFRKQRGVAGALGVGAVCALALGSVGMGANAATPNQEPSEMEIAHGALSREAATQVMVLLDNRSKTLPLKENTNVALYGVASYRTVAGGTGSGSVNNRNTVNIHDGLEAAGFNITTSDEYWNALVKAGDEAGSGGGIFGGIDYAAIEQALTDESIKPKADTDTAIYAVARNSGEFTDRTVTKGDYYLGETERANLEKLAAAYDNVIVLLNTGGIVDSNEFDQINTAVKDPSGGDAIDAVLLVSQPGQEAGHAIADVIKGAAVPQGKLTDSWASKYEYYPASDTFANHDGDSMREEYKESIYVGYRYFDSFYKELNEEDPDSVVTYPFGFGLSYTDFEIDCLSAEANADKVTVKARVRNVGDKFSGREVVQVYASAPDGKLDQPYQELVGYGKTSSLAPGKSEIVTITFATSLLASYDEELSANVYEAGDYLLRVGSSSRDTKVVAKIPVAERTVVEQLSTQLVDDDSPESELKADRSNFYGYETEAAEVEAAVEVPLDLSGFEAENNASEIAQNVEVGEDSAYYALDRNLISTVKTYLDPEQTNWENTGEPYKVKTGEVVEATVPAKDATLYDVYRGDVAMNDFVAGLSVTEMANIVEGARQGGSTMTASGSGGYTTFAYENRGIAGMALLDGPAGLRMTQRLNTNPVTYQWATAWPIASGLAQTWDPALIEKIGEAVGAEMLEYGATIWLAPSLNIHRDPMNGRNFEYYSEDPLVSGVSASATTLGVQSNAGVGVSLKHFAANNQETSRMGSNSVIGERALREIYLKGFEIAVKEAAPMTVMSSYNAINGTYAPGSYDLLMDVLRGEWGFAGLVMTDWTSIRYTGVLAAMYAGNDLVMPGNAPNEIINAIVVSKPTMENFGLPVMNKTVQADGRTSYSYALGHYTLAASGTSEISTVVNGDTDLEAVPGTGTTTVDAINNTTFEPLAPFKTVDNAYDYVAAQLEADTPGLSSAQKAAISISDIQIRECTPEEEAEAFGVCKEVSSFKVTMKVNIPERATDMRLGDLQRSTAAVLDIVMQSRPFEELAEIKGVEGITVAPYADQFPDRPDYLVSSTEEDAQPDVGVTVQTRCVAKKVTLAVSVKNNEETAQNVTVSTPYGKKTIEGVAPGKTVSQAFSTRLGTMPVGEVLVTISSGEGDPVDISVPFDEATCQ